MDDLNSVCKDHGHEPGLPDRSLRNHVLAQAIRLAEAELREHGYDDPECGAEVLHVAPRGRAGPRRASRGCPLITARSVRGR